MKPKFKYLDKVKVIDGFYKGQEGTVFEFYNGDYAMLTSSSTLPLYILKLSDGNYTRLIREKYLELNK